MDGRLVRKIATADFERQRLADEARVLSASAHPGVVRVLELKDGDRRSELVLAEVAGSPLSADPKLDWSEVAGLGAALATTLADLHDIGVVHRAVTADHVIIDERGRPVLCGFGRAVLHGDHAEARAQAFEDVASLAILMCQSGDGSPPRALARLLGSVTRRRAGFRPWTARRLARDLVRTVPDSRLPDCSADAGSFAHPTVRCPAAMPRLAEPRSHLIPLKTAALVGVLTVVVWVVGYVSSNRPKASAHRTAACPAADRVCSGEVVASGSVLMSPRGRFALIGVAGLEVNGRWRCSNEALPAVLSLRTGNVWMFDAWPTSAAGETGRFVRKVSNATGLLVVPRPNRGIGCDSLLVKRGRLRPITISLRTR